jgi:hypothetical protein
MSSQLYMSMLGQKKKRPGFRGAFCLDPAVWQVTRSTLEG